MSEQSKDKAELPHDAYRAPSAEAPMQEDLKQRGKMWVALMIGAQVLLLLAGLIEVGMEWRDVSAAAVRGVSFTLVLPLLVYGITLGLFSALYRGQDWARTTLVILFGLSAVSIGTVVVTEGLAFLKDAGFWQLARAGDTFWVLGTLLAAPSIRALIGRTTQPTKQAP